MTKTEISQAHALTVAKIRQLGDWVVKHSTNPYMSKVGQDMRYWETERDRLSKLYDDTYPTLQELENADRKTVMLWYRTMHTPTTEQEIKIRARAAERIAEYTHTLETRKNTR